MACLKDSLGKDEHDYLLLYQTKVSERYKDLPFHPVYIQREGEFLL